MSTLYKLFSHEDRGKLAVLEVERGRDIQFYECVMHTKAHIAIFIALQCIKSLLFYPLLCMQRSSLFSWCVSINGCFGVSVSKWEFFLSFQKDFRLVVGRVRKSWKIEKVMMIIRSKVWSLSMHSRYMNIFSWCEQGVLDRETLQDGNLPFQTL